jgi:hypothetical protein
VTARLTAAFAVAALLTFAAPAAAAPGMETGIADDAVLLAGGQTAADAVAEWQRLGVDVARVHVHWLRIAPEDSSAAQPAGFDPRNPDDPMYHWEPLDNAIALLEQAGIRPMLAVTGPGPLWTSSEPARGNPRWAPDARKFGDFAYAVAKRYGARVQRYLIWNEPNQPAWLQPQFTCSGTTCRPASPQRYRDLYRAAYKAIRSADADSQILIGTLAPKGQDPITRNRTMRPLQFVRALACVDDKRLARVRTGACKGQTTVRADGFAYHPHPVRFSPTTPNPIKDNAAIADMPHFEAVLDKATRNGIIKPTHGSVFDLYLTEFGYQTNPPDSDSGVSPATQAKWLQQSWFQAWADPRVRNITQYEWRDEPLRVAGENNYASWQSGLRFDDGRPKPSLTVFPNPFYVQVKPGATKARLWGQVRPGGSWPITVEAFVGGRWTALKTVQTDAFGYWSQRLPLGSGRSTYRFSYVRDGVTVRSSQQTVKPLR